jgi:hypothetical protein
VNRRLRSQGSGDLRLQIGVAPATIWWMVWSRRNGEER